MDKRPARPGKTTPASAPTDKPGPSKKPAATGRTAPPARTAPPVEDPPLDDTQAGAGTDDDAGDFLLEHEPTTPAPRPTPPGKSQTPPSKSSGKTAAPANPGQRTQSGAATGRTQSGARSVSPARNSAAGGESTTGEKPTPRNSASSGVTEGGGKVNLIGDYKLVKKLGAGGMGAVYKAWQVSLEREVALKLLSRELAGKPAFVERFKREARVMARLDHPNILRCFDVGEASGWHYLAMEFVEGGSVEGWLKKLGKFSIADGLHIILATARGLQHAHEQNMIHRDIKPDNILLTGKGVVKVADLGLAKAQDEDMSLTKTGTGAGTPIYMAPEQARDAKHVDARVDIYALGCMLYCLLTGETPFKGETLVELIDAKTKGKFTPARHHNAEIPPRLDLIIDKMIQAKPEHRFPGCTEVIEALEELGLAGERLSFLGGDPEEPPVRKTPAAASAAAAKPAGNRTRLNSTGSGGTRVNSSAGAEEEAAPKAADGWYVKLMIKGKPLTKRVTRAQLEALITSASIGPDTQVSQHYSSGYRPLGTWKQFEGLLKARQVKTKADKGGEKYRDLYKQIEKQDERRRRWKGFMNLLGAGGGIIGGLIRFILIVTVGLGLFFGGWYLFNMIGGSLGGLL